MPCKRCGSSNLDRDNVTENLVCSQCGTVQEFDNYEAQLGGIRGPQGTYIRVGYVGTGSVLAYRDKKIFEANNLIEYTASKLNLTDKVNDIKTMIKNITEGEFGQGDWLEVLIGACGYVVTRMDKKTVLPMEEVAVAIGCDLYELGSMIRRVVEHLGLELPEFDLVGLFDRSVKNSARLSRVEREKKERIVKQGVFLMNCSIKWFLSTGRRPLPLVVAVLAFVTEVNGVQMRIEDLAKEAQVALSTCKKRYKELLEKLVEVAQEVGLPWGKDITVKNVVKHAGAVIGYMEAKSMTKSSKGTGKELVCGSLDLEDVVRDCLSKETRYWDDEDDGRENVSRYFEVGGENKSASPGFNNTETGEISLDRLSILYKKFKDDVRAGKLGKQSQRDSTHKRTKGFEIIPCGDWWKGESELSRSVLLKEVLEKDVGLDALPPSYLKGCTAVERRRERIDAAKLRINRIKHPSGTGSGGGNSLDDVDAGKKRKRKRRQVSDIDWEDLIIETLLLHQVKEEEIEKGHYKTLLDLHVFNSGEV